MNFEQIVKEEADLAMNKSVLFGAVGAVAGFLVANKYGLSAPAGGVTVLAGHFAGHSLAGMMSS